MTANTGRFLIHSEHTAGTCTHSQKDLLPGIQEFQPLLSTCEKAVGVIHVGVNKV